ncbi:YadA-like family protein [Moraxella atlantae]|uniref:YadA-like family protein n=1 Tax=Faucicola atlantae TaxID=34059 RepID=UPI0037538007
MTINNGNNAQPVTLTKDGLNNGGNKITNVAAGTADTDAVNVSQLQTAQAKATTKLEDGTATTVSSTPNADGSTTYNVNVQTDGTTLTVNGDNQLTAVTTALNSDGKGNTNATNPNNLVKAGDIANAINNAGFNLQTNGDEASLVKNGDTVQLLDGQNIAITREGNNITVATTKDLVADSLTTGNTVVNNDGVTLTGGNNQPVTLTNNGLNNGGNKITNVAAGTADTDAVNVSQLQTAQAKATTKLEDGTATTVSSTPNADGSTTYKVNAQTDGTTLTVNGDNQLTAKTSGISAGNDGRVTTNEGDDPNSLVTAGNVTNAINNAGFNLQTNGDEASLVKNGDTVQLLDGQNIAITREGNNITVATTKDLVADSLTTGNTVVNNDGVTLTGGNNQPVTLTNNGLNNGGNKITNVAAGTADTDAVNVSQLQTAQAKATTKLEDGTATTVSSTPNADGSTTYKVNAQTDGTTLTVNGDNQLIAVTTALNSDGKGNTNATNPDNLVKAGDIANAINNAGFNLQTNGDEASLIKNGDTVQLLDGQNIAITREGNNITVATTKDLVADSLTTGDTVINNSGVTINNGNNAQPVTLTKDGLNNGGNKITNVAAGTADTDAVNVSQLQTAQAKATTKLEDGTATTVSSTPNADGSTTYNVNVQTDGTTLTVNGDNQLTAVTTALNSDGKGNTNATNPNNLVKAGDIANAINNAGFNLQTNGDEASLVKNGDTVQLLDGQNIAITREGNNITVATTKDLVADSLTTGNTVVNNDGVTLTGGNNQPVTLTNNGLNNGGNKITNVAAGTADTDAVNVSQLQTAQAKATTKLEDGTATTVSSTPNADGSTTYKVNAQTDGTTLTVNGDNQLTAKTSGISAGNDGRVTTNEGDDPNSLVTAGNVTNAINNAGFNLQTNGDEASLVKNGDTVQLLDGQNIAITREGNNITVATTKDLVADSLTTGNTVVNNDGVTLTGGNNQPVTLTNNGLNNGGNKITNVAAGTADTDAVNVSQLQTAQAKATTKLEDGTATTVSSTPNADGSTTYKVNAQTDGTTLTVNGDNQLTAKTSGISAGNDGRVTTNEGDDPNSLVTAGNVTNAINNAGFNLQTNGDEASLVKNGDTVQLLDGQNIAITREGNNITVATTKDLVADSLTTGNTVVNNDGVTLTGGNNQPVTLTNNGLNNGGNKITNVAAGTADTDAVNVSQLQTAQAKATTKLEDGTATTVSSTPNADGSTTYKVNAQTDGTTLTVNGDNQLTAKTSGISAGNDGRVTTNEGDDPNSLVTAGNVTNAINNAGFNLQTNGDEASLVKNGDTVQLLDGQNIAITREGNNITVATTKDLVADSLTTGNTVVNNDGVTLTGGNNQPVTLTNNGLNNGGNKITNVAAGTADTDAVNVSQLQTAQAKATTKLEDGTATTVSSTPNADGSTTYKVNAQTDGTTLTVNGDNQLTAKTSGISAGNDGRVTTNEGDDPNSLVTAGNVTNAINNAGFNLQTNGDEASLVKNGDTVQLLDGQNIAITREGNNITVATTKDLVADSLTTGDTVINNSGVAINNGNNAQPVTLTKDGLNNGGNKITNVAAGTADTDAVNVSQLQTAQAKATTKLEDGTATTVETTTNEDGSTTYKVNAQTDGTTLTVNGDNQLTAKTSGISAGNDGRVTTNEGDDPNSLVTAGNVTNAINNAGFNLQTNGDEASLVKNGDTVQLLDGQNIAITREGNNITVATTKDLVADSLTTGDQNGGAYIDRNIIGVGDNSTGQATVLQPGAITVGGPNNGIRIEGDAGKINGLTNKTFDPNNIVSGQAATEDQLQQAAAAATTKLEDGTATTVSSTPNADGSTTYKVNAQTDGTTLTVNGDNQLTAVTTALNSDGKGNTNATNPDNLVKAGDIANAINNAGFNLQTNGDEASLIKNGDTVQLLDGQNIAITREGNNITVATKPNVVFASVKAGNTTINQDGIDNGGNKITNVAAGTADTDAVNVSQLQTAQAKATTKLEDGTATTVSSTPNADGSTTYKVNAQTDGTTLTVNGDNQLTAVTTALNSDGKGNTNATNPDNLVKAGDIANAINNAGFNLQTNGDEASLIKNGDTVQLLDGQNIAITREGNNITVATKPNVVFDSVKAGNTTINQDGIDNGGKLITNVASGLQGKTLNQIKDEGSSSSQWSNAATIGDLTQVQTNISNTQQIVGGVDIDGNVVDGDGSMLTVVNADNSTTPITLTAAEALRTYDAVGTGTVETNSVLTAVKNINEQGTKYIHFNGGERSVGGQRGMNDEQSQANGSKSTAIGYKTDANGDAAVAIGNQVLANGQQAIAIGDRAQALGSQSISIGTKNIVTGKNSGAIGDPSIIDGDNSYSIGNNNRIGGTTQNAFILGNNVQLGADNDGNVTSNVSGAVALGNNTSVNVAGGVALGENSVASRAGLGSNVTTSSGTITQATSDTTSQVFALQQSSQADKDAIIATATNSVGAVSVGREGANRQITNVAAGSLDSDAVNVAQLRAAAQAASQAATAASSKVAAGQNITVTSAPNTDGSTTYTVATTPNLVADSLTINNGDNPVTLNASGLNNGGNRITNVAKGVDGTDAVNVDQLNNAINSAASSARTEIKAGTNIANVVKTTGENAQNIYTINALGASTTAGSDAVTVTSSDAGNNVTNYAVDLSDATKASLAKADSAVQNIQAGQNVAITRDGNNVTVATTPNLVADSLTTGDTVVNNAGLTINNGPSVTQRGINAGDQKITNVAAGDINADSKDAVNGSQLYATNQNVTQVQGDVAKLNNGAAGVVRYSNADTPTTPNGGVVSNDVTLVGKANEPVTIHNVAPGRAVTDAVNVGQLSALEGKVNNAVNKLGYRIDDVHDQANAGISAAMATAALPQAFLPGKSMVSGGLASYNGEGAVAVGVSTLSDNGRWVIKLSGTADTQGNAGGSIGAGFHW